MKGRINVSNPKELSKTAKILGMSTWDFVFFFVVMFLTSKIHMESIYKIILTVVLIALNKFINRNHPFAIYPYLIKRKNKLIWAGKLKEFKK